MPTEVACLSHCHPALWTAAAHEQFWKRQTLLEALLACSRRIVATHVQKRRCEAFAELNMARAKAVAMQPATLCKV